MELQDGGEDCDDNVSEVKPKVDPDVKMEDGFEVPDNDNESEDVEVAGCVGVSTSPRNWGELKDMSMSEDDWSPLSGQDAPVVLHLELCEAFFLSYSLGCLTVSDETGCQLSLLEMWQLFRQLEPDFPLRYRVYHHYRALGWVVRSGYCMGADWGLYKLGPAMYHATYTVRVEGIDKKSGEVVEIGLKKITWGDMLAQTRVAVTVKKDLLVARVEVWGDMRDWDSPHCLRSMAVTATRVKRWVVGDQRWTVKPKVPVEVKPGCDKESDAVIVLD